MNQHHLSIETNEPVSDWEVRALIERFGERQSVAAGQPTVKDVAEALQLEPETVGKMLSEIRQAKGEIEIKQRLDKLEQENEELRNRGPFASNLHTPFGEGRVRRPFLTGMVAAIAVVALMTKFAVFRGPNPWMQQFVVMAVLASLIFFVGRLLSAKSDR